MLTTTHTWWLYVLYTLAYATCLVAQLGGLAEVNSGVCVSTCGVVALAALKQEALSIQLPQLLHIWDHKTTEAPSLELFPNRLSRGKPSES